MKILVINGPNINMLGIREKNIYGEESYDALLKKISACADELGVEVECYQSNHEGDIVDKIQAAYGNADGLVINAAAYTHTSVAILDAVKAVSIPAVEVHISDIYSRDEFRHRSYVGMACEEHIIGHGFEGYCEAMRYLAANPSVTP